MKNFSKMTAMHDFLNDLDKKLNLECDGFTRVVTYVLNHYSVPHTVYAGEATVDGATMEPHFWIVTEDGLYIDYRLRMWLGQTASHGIFQASQFPNVTYKGSPVAMETPDMIFRILSGGISLPNLK